MAPDPNVAGVRGRPNAPRPPEVIEAADGTFMRFIGWFRFLPESPGKGVVGQVISASSDGWQYPSDVPVYRRSDQ